MNGANCVGEAKRKSALVQQGEPWNPDSLPPCAERRPLNPVPYPFVGADCVPEVQAPPKQDQPKGLA